MTDSIAVEYLRYQIAEQEADAFEAAICKAMAMLDGEPTVKAYEITKSDDGARSQARIRPSDNRQPITLSISPDDDWVGRATSLGRGRAANFVGFVLQDLHELL